MALVCCPCGVSGQYGGGCGHDNPGCRDGRWRPGALLGEVGQRVGCWVVWWWFHALAVVTLRCGPLAGHGHQYVRKPLGRELAECGICGQRGLWPSRRL